MRDNNNFNVTTSKILWLLALFFSIHSYAQSFISTCGEDFHGNGHAHQDCIEDIVVTSTESEGAEGTLFSGIIYSEGKINIRPGVSKVRILYETNSNLGRRNSKLTHRTKIGGNGGDPGIISSTTLTLYPNPTKGISTLSSTQSKIISYQVFDFYGTLLHTHTFKTATVLTKINLSDFQQGFYLLQTQLQNGQKTTKTLIKN
tara:strand:+ start:849 stop:1454 length:606 start_codon:yes stop_codon:yes gene_type:complete